MSKSYEFNIPYFYKQEDDTIDLEEQLTIPDFEDISSPLISRAVEVADIAMSKAGLDNDELSGILLAGGTSQVPLVKETLEHKFECSAMIIPKDLMWLIAKGAAIYHKELMTRPKEVVRTPLGADLYLETFTQGRLEKTLLVNSHQSLPHKFTREFPINSNNSVLTIQLSTESGSSKNGILNLDRRIINIEGLKLEKIIVNVDISRNRNIKLSVLDPKTRRPLEKVEISGELFFTDEQIQNARKEYGFTNIPLQSSDLNQKYAIGIDLGTTTCEAIIWDSESKTFLHGIDEPQLSQVLIRDNGLVTVDNGNHSTEMKGYFSNFKVDIHNKQTDKYEFNGKTWPPHLLSAHLLTVIWQKIHSKIGSKSSLTEAVITIPSDFSEDQTALVELAAKIAGIPNPILLTEPVAAFLAYSEAFNLNKRADKNYLIFDFGGGTTDVCIIKTIENDRVEIITSKGNNRIGGKDLTQKISEHIIDQFELNNGLKIDQKERERLYKLLFKKSDSAKIQLSEILISGIS
jgi:molecular chaperone DnaK (HSP70)